MLIGLVYSSETQKGIIQGLRDLKHIVVPFYYGCDKGIDYLTFRFLLSSKRQKVLEQSFNYQLHNLYGYYRKRSLDLLIVLKGHTLSEETRDLLSKMDIPKIQWTIDSVERWPGQSSLFHYMDKVYFQDGEDVKLKESSEWLPLGFDDSVYKYNWKKEIDLLFVGNVKQPYYCKRRECFIELSFLAKKGYKVMFAGSNPDNDLLDVFKQNGVRISKRLNLKDYAALISKSKICVNIHQDDGGKAINPLFFAVPATGGLELSDNYDYLAGWLKPNWHYFPTSLNTIRNDAANLLMLSPLAEDTANEVKTRHSFYSRAKTILDDLQ